MTSIANGELGSTVRSKLNASLTVTDAFTVSGANVGIGASSPQSVLNVEKSSSANTISAAASVILSNRNETAGTFLAGGVFSNTYRDISTTCYTAGVWFEKQTSAANGAFSSQGAIIFGTNDSTGSGAFPSERMRIDASGNVGIGTSSPSFSAGSGLHIYRASGAAVKVEDASTNADLLAFGGTLYLSNRSNGPLTLSTNNAERMRIDNIGNVGIGTSSPASQLQVEGGSVTCNIIASSGNGTFRLANSATAANRKEFFIVLDTTNNRVDMQAIQQGTSYNSITLNAGGGNVGIGTTSPNAASVLDAQSTTQGVRFPNMTTTQKAAIANVAGNVVFDTTLGKLCVNNGSAWQTITSV